MCNALLTRQSTPLELKLSTLIGQNSWACYIIITVLRRIPPLVANHVTNTYDFPVAMTNLYPADMLLEPLEQDFVDEHLSDGICFDKGAKISSGVNG